MTGGALLAIGDLHIGHAENRRLVEGIRPGSEGDWLLVAGDVSETYAEVAWALALLRDRFRTVVWVPGNHELWTHPEDPVRSRGEARYRELVDLCRGLGVHTPEDPYPVWQADGRRVVVAPLFVLYDYSFRPPGAVSAADALARAEAAGVVCTDEFLLHPDPYPGRGAWCQARVAYSEARLAALDGAPTVLVNHHPLVREPTRVLRHPEFALWCGTERTADWHTRFNAAAVVHGHLHIPRTLAVDGVPFQEVSLGYPREWRSRPGPPARPRPVLLNHRAGRAGPAVPDEESVP
ncbi:metallophosphoesterase [Streptomyces bambusae]|uniref:metallophosphoesterase family protein n=1 Tax=Streptomyces bambusae TaxID=1550616 RepID=UPI001CFE1B8F|nr:metallophosphoesterase [Streptomyces bambusae]MCB5168261.1 metallophosphoesterase [Streptomyces bambusae]